MIIFGKPRRPKFYICVDSDVASKLHELGFSPTYRDMGDLYFTKTNEIVEVIKRCNLKTK